MTEFLLDNLLLLPFLFVTYLVLEILEARAGGALERSLGRTRRLGPLFGALAGAVPQCGFSAAAASLYSGGVITAGTLIAVFLSTSDEMVPIFLSSAVPAGTIGRILLAKFVIALVSGITIDAGSRAARRWVHADKHIHDLCEREHCGCGDEEGGIFRSALVHTLKITLFIFIISLILSLLVGFLGEDAMASMFSGAPLAGTVIAALIGLIPNCAASVAVTQMYLGGILTTGQLMAGLLTGAGVGLLVLFRTNAHHRENLAILAALFALGVFWGSLIDLMGFTLQV